MTVLPPKRYESIDDPIYDPIRHHHWFWLLVKRREKLTFLRSAAVEFGEGAITQQDAARKWGVNRKELREYVQFHEGKSPVHDHGDLVPVLNRAYQLYDSRGGAKSFTACLQAISGKRVHQELWEKDPNLYPSIYRRPKQ